MTRRSIFMRPTLRIDSSAKASSRSALILGRKNRSEMIGVFLALLELIREKKILAHQAEALGELEIEIAPEEHRRQYAHASLHLADEKPEEQLDESAAQTETTNESPPET